jgi:hypothetical protein
MAGRLTNLKSTSKEDDLESYASYGDGPSLTKSTKYAWSGAKVTENTHPANNKGPAEVKLNESWTQVDNDAYHKMLEEYRAAKSKQKEDELKIKQCVRGF